MTRRRYDRTGEPIELDDEPDAYVPHDQRCDNGWLGEDPDTGAPTPCLLCRPHLPGLLRRNREHP